VSGIKRYAVAFLFVGVSLGIRFILKPWLGQNVPFLLFLPAILLAAWHVGFGPAVLATAASTLAAMYFVLPPDGLAVNGTPDLLSLALFVTTGAGIAWLSGRVRSAETHRESAAALATARAERLDAIINTTVDGIIVISAKGTIESFNRGAERLFEYPASEAIGRNVSMLMPSPHREEHDRYLDRYLASGQAKIIGIGREVTGRRRDGTVFPLHLSVGEMVVGGERKFTGMLHDLSQRKQLEDQLREKTALARLGEMAAVIAHEVKNPLAGIRGAIQVIGGRMPSGTQDALMMKEIVSRIDALDEMVKDLLLFARPPEPRRAPTDVVPIVATAAHLLSRDPALHQIEIQVEGSAPPVPADAEMLKIVFQNLLVNAAHAMEGRGRIRVGVAAVDSTCQIIVADTGPGIPPEIRDKIFTPFFTTKSRGSGLGLPTAKRLIDAHDGQILIDCPPTGGTRVLVQLPMASP
jgi:two-component system sensor kinase FixL